MTSSSLSIRLTGHRCKYRNEYGVCSSCKLNLYNSVIICLENNLTEKEAIEREKYYIRNNQCVNEVKYTYNSKEYREKWEEKNKEKLRLYNKEYRVKNKDKINEMGRQYYVKNKEEITKKNKEYREKNKDKINEMGRQYHHKNKDKIREKRKEYREKNKEEFKEKHKEYYEKNKDKINEQRKITIWHCDICNCDIRFSDKSRHLKTQKHINNSLK